MEGTRSPAQKSHTTILQRLLILSSLLTRLPLVQYWAEHQLSRDTRDFLLSHLSSANMRPGAMGVTIMVVDRRRLETVGGTSSCPSGLLGPLSPSAPPDTRGREPGRPRGCRLALTTPGFFLLMSRRPAEQHVSFLP